jgi:hypothetical protein
MFFCKKFPVLQPFINRYGRESGDYKNSNNSNTLFENYKNTGCGREMDDCNNNYSNTVIL